jgi:hypothetical protein
VLPAVRQLKASGTTTVRAIAEALNARDIRTARVGRLVARQLMAQNLLTRDTVAS